MSYQIFALFLFIWLIVVGVGEDAFPAASHADDNNKPLSDTQGNEKSFSWSFTKRQILGARFPRAVKREDNPPAPVKINPVNPKFDTTIEEGMPGYLNFSVWEGISRWDERQRCLIVDGEHFGVGLQGDYYVWSGLSNGYIGSENSLLGPMPEIAINKTSRNGVVEGYWPDIHEKATVAGVSGFYACPDSIEGSNFPELRDRGCESVQSGIPYYAGMSLRVGNESLTSNVDLAEITDGSLRLYPYDGYLAVSYTWKPKLANVSFDIQFKVFADRINPNAAGTQMSVTSSGDTVAYVVDQLDGVTARRAYLSGKKFFPNQSTINVAVHPEGVPNITAVVSSTADVSNGFTDEGSRKIISALEHNMTLGQEWKVNLRQGKTATFSKVVGIATSDHFTDPWVTATNISSLAFNNGFETLFFGSKAEWNRLMGPNRVDNYSDPVTGVLPNDTQIRALQLAAIMDKYYILQDLLPQTQSPLNDQSISVGGLASDSYGGMKFWDADWWVFIGIVHTDPDYARQILNYRIKLWEQAKLNAQQEYVQAIYNFDPRAAIYPWTSGRIGNATATGPVINYEFHLNSDIALSMIYYAKVTGDDEFFHNQLWPIVESIGFAQAGVLCRENGGWSVNNVTDPDEYSNHVKNPTFTLAAFSEVFSFAVKYQESHNLPVDETWRDMADNVNIAWDDKLGMVAAYDGMPVEGVNKQASTELTDHPLDFGRFGLSTRQKNLAFYRARASPDGPAMTDTVYAISHNQLAAGGCGAFEAELKARFLNRRAPFSYLSEQADDDPNANGGIFPAYPFKTAHGANLQINHYGYLGYKISAPNFTISPSLPLPHPPFTLADFYANGNRVRASMNHTHTVITRLEREERMRGVVFDGFGNGTMDMVVRKRDVVGNKWYTEVYGLEMGVPVVFENDMYWAETGPDGELRCNSRLSLVEAVIKNGS